jgi:hypothetical protein
MATEPKKKELKVKHFQNPEDLCAFVNESEITIHSIVAYDRFQALYFYIK